MSTQTHLLSEVLNDTRELLAMAIRTLLPLMLLCAPSRLCASRIAALANGSDATGSDLSPMQAAAIVKKHNDLRSIMGASDMMKLTWSPDLAARAQLYSSDSPRCHDNNPNYKIKEARDVLGLDGENTLTSDGRLTPETDVTASVQSWWDEKKDCGCYQTGGEFSGFDLCKGYCAHYTQMVWSSANEIGCGLSSCKDVGPRMIDGVPVMSYVPGFQLTCQYRSTLPGRTGRYMKDHTVFTKGKYCSACPDGISSCVNALCSEPEETPSLPADPKDKHPKAKSKGGAQQVALSLVAGVVSFVLAIAWA